MKATPTAQKLRGGYYTPPQLATFLTQWAIRSPDSRVLEPSCGDGNVLIAAAATLKYLGTSPTGINQQLYGVEINPDEAMQATQRLNDDGFMPHIHTGDFFSYCKSQLLGIRELGQTHADIDFFDAVVGNPPFIRYQSFPTHLWNVAVELMGCAGLRPNRLTNAWVPFLVASTLVLREGGRLAMVIPAELLQVNYAGEIRQFLGDMFDLTMITFRKLIWKEAQQDVVLLLGERSHGRKHTIRVLELDTIDDLNTTPGMYISAEEKPLFRSKDKWIHYFLDNKEISLLESLKNHSFIHKAGKYIDVDVGIVTGYNSFFILNQQQVEACKLGPYTEPIVSRSAQLKGLQFSHSDWLSNARDQLPTFFFNPSNDVLNDDSVQHYLRQGKESDVPLGYKCRNRPFWYRVPSLWSPQAFFLRQIHGYPKIIINTTSATSTDTIHRVRFIPNTIMTPTMISSALLNSLTFASAEITGRSYGGGVLTFEPTEAEKLLLPICSSFDPDFERVDRLLREGKIDEIVQRNDQNLLIGSLGLDGGDVVMLHSIWDKLRNRRNNRRSVKTLQPQSFIDEVGK